MPGQPLDGMIVVEWCELAAGPSCGKWLAEAGADVIKIEAPHDGDLARWYGPFPGDEPHPERSALFLSLNTNKRSVTLNTRNPAGASMLWRLLAHADVLLEDRSAEEVERVHIDFPTLHEAFPKLLVTSITPYGRTGPNRDWKAHPLNVVHSSGATAHQLAGRIALEEFPEAPPVKPAAFAAEIDAGIQAALATLAAIYVRERSGIGQHIDLSRQWAMASTQRAEVTRSVTDGLVMDRGLDTLRLAGVYRCVDGYVVIGAITGQRGWEALADMLGTPHWVDEPWFEELWELAQLGIEKPPYADTITASIAEYCAMRTREEIREAGQRRGLTISGVHHADEVLALQQPRLRGFLRDREHPETGPLPHVGLPFRSSTAGERPSGPAPTLGAHTDEVLRDMLGLPETEIAMLRISGAI